jgi:hypothetical protein
MTGGLGRVLTLPSRGITSGATAAPIFYRFISAHWVAYLVLLPQIIMKKIKLKKIK